MLALSHTLALGLTLLCPQAVWEDVFPLKNLLVMSTDAKVVAKVKKEYRYGIPLAEFTAKFSDDRFVLDKWGNQGAILIDRQIPLLVKRESQRDLLRSLLDNVGPDSVVRIGEIPPHKRTGFMAAVEEMFPWHSRPDGFDLGRAAVGLNANFNVTVHSNDPGSDKNITLPMPEEMTRARDRTLDAYPMPQKGRELSEAERASIVKEGDARNSELERSDFHTFGTARKNIVEGLRECARVLDGIFAEVDSQAKEAAEELMDKVGFAPSLRSMPKGKVPFSELPGETRNQLIEQAGADWKFLGFASPGDAQQFILNSGSIEVTLSIGMRRTYNPYNPQTHEPRSGMVYNFVLIRR